MSRLKESTKGPEAPRHCEHWEGAATSGPEGEGSYQEVNPRRASRVPSGAGPPKKSGFKLSCSPVICWCLSLLTNWKPLQGAQLRCPVGSASWGWKRGREGRRMCLEANGNQPHGCIYLTVTTVSCKNTYPCNVQCTLIFYLPLKKCCL